MLLLQQDLYIYASKEIHTVKFMTYKTKKMKENYYEPIKEFFKRTQSH